MNNVKLHSVWKIQHSFKHFETWILTIFIDF
jgi:hypothetical protein